MTVCGINITVLIDRNTDAYKIHKRHLVYFGELKDIFDTWTTQLFNDSSNTRSSVCCYLVELAGLTEGNSYRKMMQPHEYGDAVIVEYCQEHAEHYTRKL